MQSINRIIFFVLVLSFFQNGKAQDKVKTFYDSGNLKTEGIIKNGKRSSDWSYYFEDGNLRAIEKYRSGFIVQKKEYFASGELKVSVYMLNASNALQAYYYDREGRLIKSGLLNNDQQEIGEWLYYSDTGELIKTLKFKDGQIID